MSRLTEPVLSNPVHNAILLRVLYAGLGLVVGAALTLSYVGNNLAL